MMDSLLSWFLAVFVCLFLTTSTFSQTTRSPSQWSPIYVAIKYKQKLATLHCPIHADNQMTLKWSKDNKIIDHDDEESKHFTFESDSEGTRLKITTPVEKDLGNYSCQLYYTKNFTAVESMIVNFIVISDLTLKIEEAISVIEGEKLKIRCVVTSKTPPYQMKWRVGNKTYEASEGRVTLSSDEKNITNAVFSIDAANMGDRGSYICMGYATEKSNATEIESYVRVKDKYAALWPFLGICAEVVILCTIILIYEKKRNKAELDESDTDQSPDQKNTPDMGKDSVRQRK